MLIVPKIPCGYLSWGGAGGGEGGSPHCSVSFLVPEELINERGNCPDK